jgi:hypothetical protein
MAMPVRGVFRRCKLGRASLSDFVREPAPTDRFATKGVVLAPYPVDGKVPQQALHWPIGYRGTTSSVGRLGRNVRARVLDRLQPISHRRVGAASLSPMITDRLRGLPPRTTGVTCARPGWLEFGIHDWDQRLSMLRTGEAFLLEVCPA